MALKKLPKINISKDNGSVVGFTLIELLTAIAVFFIGILGAFSLSLSNLNTGKDNYNRVVAADLAREGMEIVRNMRDSNWLAREANVDSDPSDPDIDLYEWDSGLNLNNNFTVNYLNNNLVQLGNPGDTLSNVIILEGAKLYLGSGFYTNDSSVGNQNTVFRRAINLRAICLDITTGVETIPIPGSLDCVSLEKIGLQVTSRVQYTYGAKTNHIDAVENIYNWRQ